MDLVVFCSVPNLETAEGIARALVEESLAACVNVVPSVTSVYRWEGKVTVDSELLLVIKTRGERYAALEARVLELHPYDVPEVIAVGVERGSPRYLDWLAESVRPPPSG